MRQLSETLIAAQRQASRTPYIKVEARNTIFGVARLDWERLYSGSEADCYHGMTMPGDGSMVRVRLTPLDDAQKLYRQRVADPSPQSDFSQWVYTNQYNALVVTCCSLGAEVSIFWIRNDRAIYQMKSTDYGVSWGSPVIVDYAPTAIINGIAAAYKPNGDLALFFSDQSTLYVKKRLNGIWQSRVAWDKSTGDLSSVAVVYDGDWSILIAGQDTADNFKVWSLLYGDGEKVPAGEWSELQMMASAPADGDFKYDGVFLDKPDALRAFFVEHYTGIEAYHRPFWSNAVSGNQIADNLWREPVPFNLSSEYGLAPAHHDDYCWLSSPNGVWRARLNMQSLELTGDVINIREELAQTSGRLAIELRNDECQYATPGQGSLAALDIGCQIDFSPGYVSCGCNEVSEGLAFILESYEYTSAGGKASILLRAEDGWSIIRNWRARHQFRWNKDTADACVRDILSFVLARSDLKLEVKSQSAVVTGFYPDFAIQPGASGEAVIERLLSFVPDVLFIEGDTAYLVNPLPEDESSYSYGDEHPVLEGRYRKGIWEFSRVQVEGQDSETGEAVIVDSFGWDEIGRFNDRLRQVEDNNIHTVAEAQQRGDAWLREAEIESYGGYIRTPVNCGQQLYDVVDVTDSRAGLAAERRRVLGINLVFSPGRSEYEQRLLLGAV